MARRPKRQYRRTGGNRSFRYLRGNVDESVTLATLAGRTLISSTFDETVNERTLVTSIRALYSLEQFTKVAGDGPIWVGVAHSDYTDAEIEEVLEITTSWNEGDKIGQERAKRKVRKIGIFDVPNSTAEVSVLNDGKPIKTKLNWILLQGQTLKLWVYNLGSGGLTAGSVVRAQGNVNLWPR